MKKTIVILMSLFSGFASAHELVVTGEIAKSLRALDGLATADGELSVKCGANACRFVSKNIPMSWQDDADGTPFFVEQVGFRMDTAAALFKAMPKGTPVEPMAYMSGGYNPVIEVRTLGGADEKSSVIVQCEQRRYWTECVVRKVSDVR